MTATTAGPAEADRGPPEISVFLGTKAQYIKTAPLLRLLQARNINYRLIDSGQHAALTPTLRRELGVREPDFALASAGNVTTVREAAVWFLRQLCLAVLRPGRLRDVIFGGARGVCVIHGDTPSTLLALILAKRAGLKVAHIEAGLRSFNVLKPFPEELIRIVVMRFSDHLFAPSDSAMANLRAMGLHRRAVHIGQNTNVEALYHSLDKAATSGLPARLATAQYALVTIHRVETILNKRRLSKVISLIERIAAERPVAFVMHDPTRVQLRRRGLLERLERSASLTILPLMDHGAFARLIEQAAFVVTDGGSIQEECHYLGVPCLVMRGETERFEGVDGNVVLSRFDEAAIGSFLADYASFRRGVRTPNRGPSEIILASLVQELAHSGARTGRPAGDDAAPAVRDGASPYPSSSISGPQTEINRRA